jgi:hypothetical protein
MEKMDMSNMSVEEKCMIIDALPLGAAMSFPGHEVMYLGKENGKYYVISTVSSIMSPETGKRLRTRDVMINTLDVKRANGQNWLQALNMAFMPCYAALEGKTYDFPDFAWYHDGVAYCLKNGVISAASDGTFGINDATSRAVLAKALWVMAGKPAAAAAASFSDVAQDHSAAAAIAWAAESGVMTGYSETVFAPDDVVSREQLVTVLWRLAQLDEGLDMGASAELKSFRDEKKVSAYARDAFAWACGAELVTGTNAKLYPAELATRAQVAMVLCRYSQLPREAGETVSR